MAFIFMLLGSMRRYKHGLHNFDETPSVLRRTCGVPDPL